jgi:hypothetical protein
LAQLAFLDEDRLFDGHCIRFKGVDGDREVTCGIAVAVLKEYDLDLPRHGLIPAEAFLRSFEKLMIRIHDAARTKYSRGEFEPEGAVRIMIRRRDLAS